LGVLKRQKTGYRQRAVWQANSIPCLTTLFKIKQLFKLFVERRTQNQRQFRGGVKLARFNKADGIAGNADHCGKLPLRKIILQAGFF
jgi:hypothetical protein